MSMINVAVGDKHYRTKSFDTVARRLFGPKAQVVIENGKDGTVFGMFVTPDRHNPAVLRVRGHFIEEGGSDVPVPRTRTQPTVHPSSRKAKNPATKAIAPKKGKAAMLVQDDEGHYAPRYR